jgi:hypothetical protein
MLLPISGIAEPFSTNATIIRIDKIHNGYKIVLYLQSDAKNEKVLKDYIAKLQLDVIKRVKD